jgi:hypothetical protein
MGSEQPRTPAASRLFSLLATPVSKVLGFARTPAVAVNGTPTAATGMEHLNCS